MSENTDAKQPQDHKKKHHPRSEKFTFDFNGDTITIPYVENLPRRLARKVAEVAQSGEGDPDDFLFKEIMSEEDFEKLDNMTLGEYDDFTNAWNEESSISLGE